MFLLLVINVSCIGKCVCKLWAPKLTMYTLIYENVVAIGYTINSWSYVFLDTLSSSYQSHRPPLVSSCVSYKL